jgi:hypothetical protein
MGFSVAAPSDPIVKICIRRTIVYDRLTGLAAGLGRASTDAI